MVECLKENRSIIQQLAFPLFRVSATAEGQSCQDARSPSDGLAGFAQPMRPNAVDGPPALPERAFRFWAVRIRTSESVRQIRQADSGVVANPHGQEAVGLQLATDPEGRRCGLS